MVRIAGRWPSFSFFSFSLLLLDPHPVRAGWRRRPNNDSGLLPLEPFFPFLVSSGFEPWAMRRVAAPPFSLFLPQGR